MPRLRTAQDEGDDEDELDDLPATSLDEDDYEQFVRREIDAGGRLRAAPPVGAILLVLIALVLALAFVVL